MTTECIFEGRRFRHNGDVGVVTAHLHHGPTAILRIDHLTWTEARSVLVADLGESDDVECPRCGGPLASDGVCADDTCGADDE